MEYPSNNSPAVTVVLPAYNAERYIKETVTSILAQTECNLELIVVNDGSSDGTATILSTFSDGRVKVINIENSGGPAIPRNIGIEAAKGKYISFFDADDIMLPGKLAKSVSALEACPEAGFLFTDFSSINEGGALITDEFLASYDTLYRMVPEKRKGSATYLKSADLLEGLSKANFIGTSSVIVRRDMFEKVNGFDETLKNGDDYDCWVRLACRIGAVFLNDRFHLYRIHSASISYSNPIRRLENLIRLHESHTRLADLPQQFRRNSRLRAARYAQNIAQRSVGHDNNKARSYARKALASGWSAKRLAVYILSFLPSRVIQIVRRVKKIAEGR